MAGPDASALLQQYQQLGLRIVYWPRKGNDPKEWKGPRTKKWNDPALQYPIEAYDPATMNVGVVTGHEIAPGKFLIDIDFDWQPGTVMAGLLLPATHFAFGRKGKKLSHAFFTTSERLPFIKYDDIGIENRGDGVRFVEVFSGNSTHQTMVAPSLHTPPDTRIELVVSGNIAHVDSSDLQRSILDYAIACMVLRHTPNGLHHDGRLALSGMLLTSGFEPERVIAIEEAVCRAQILANVPDMSEKDVADASLNVRTTQHKILTQKKFAGAGKFAEYIGKPQGEWVVERIQKWFGKEGDFVRDRHGRPLAKHQGNIARALSQLKYELSYNEFAERLLVNGQTMTDAMVHHIYLHIDRDFHFQPPLDFFWIVVENIARQHKFHPVKDYLNSLDWDGESRVDTWLIESAGAVDSPYVRAISSKMLIAAVRRIRQPGCKYDEIVVWESPQGTNKSSAAAALCQDPEWFTDDLRLNLSSKEIIEGTLGKWVIEASELAGKRKTEIEQLKAMLSRQVDGPARMAYARAPVERPRQFILVGTTNSSVYLLDSTGGRRFWPVTVRQFDVGWVIANRDQLWAEAAVREAKGESIRLPERLWPDATVEQERRLEIDPWESKIREMLLDEGKWVNAGKTHVWRSDTLRVTADGLWEAVSVPVERRDRLGALRLSDIMQRLGFKRTRVRPPESSSVQVGYRQERGDVELRESDSERRPGEDDLPF